jgi:hypothetical protein
VAWGLPAKEDADVLALAANGIEKTPGIYYLSIARPPTAFRLPGVGDFVITDDFPLGTSIDVLDELLAESEDETEQIGGAAAHLTLREVITRARRLALTTLPLEMTLNNPPLPIQRVGSRRPDAVTLVMQDVEEGDEEEEEEEGEHDDFIEEQEQGDDAD